MTPAELLLPTAPMHENFSQTWHTDLLSDTLRILSSNGGEVVNLTEGSTLWRLEVLIKILIAQGMDRDDSSVGSRMHPTELHYRLRNILFTSHAEPIETYQADITAGKRVILVNPAQLAAFCSEEAAEYPFTRISVHNCEIAPTHDSELCISISDSHVRFKDNRELLQVPITELLDYANNLQKLAPTPSPSRLARRRVSSVSYCPPPSCEAEDVYSASVGPDSVGRDPSYYLHNPEATPPPGIIFFGRSDTASAGVPALTDETIEHYAPPFFPEQFNIIARSLQSTLRANCLSFLAALRNSSHLEIFSLALRNSQHAINQLLTASYVLMQKQNADSEASADASGTTHFYTLAQWDGIKFSTLADTDSRTRTIQVLPQQLPPGIKQLMISAEPVCSEQITSSEIMILVLPNEAANELQVVTQDHTETLSLIELARLGNQLLCPPTPEASFIRGSIMPDGCSGSSSVNTGAAVAASSGAAQYGTHLQSPMSGIFSNLASPTRAGAFSPSRRPGPLIFGRRASSAFSGAADSVPEHAGQHSPTSPRPAANRQADFASEFKPG
jgi:hypothetical protein